MTAVHATLGNGGALAAFAAPPAAWRPDPPFPPGWRPPRWNKYLPGWDKHPPLPLGHVAGPVYPAPAHTAVAGGMPGWQITLIAAAAVVLATAVAVALYRTRAARRRLTVSAAQATTTSGAIAGWPRPPSQGDPS